MIEVKGLRADGTFTVTSLFQNDDTEGAAEAVDAMFGWPGIVKVITHMEVTRPINTLNVGDTVTWLDRSRKKQMGCVVEVREPNARIQRDGNYIATVPTNLITVIA